MTVLHPAYFPNAAFFSIFMTAEKVTWEYHDNYQKQTFRNRAYICTDRGSHMLSIPILHTKSEHGRQQYKDVRIDNSYSWQRLHWRTLETAYRTSPFFEFYEDEIKPLYETPFEFLINFNLKTIEIICELLEIEFPEERTKEYALNYDMDYRFLVNAKKEIKLDDSEYVQVFGERHGFIPNLSILDLLFNLGPNTTTYLRDVEINSLNA